MRTLGSTPSMQGVPTNLPTPRTSIVPALNCPGGPRRRLSPFRCTGLPSLGWSGGVYGTYASAETRFQVPYPAIGRQHLRHHRHFPPPMRLRSGSLPEHRPVLVEQDHVGGKHQPQDDEEPAGDLGGILLLGGW